MAIHGNVFFNDGPVNLGGIAQDYMNSLDISSTQADFDKAEKMVWYYNFVEGVIYIKEGAHNIKYTHPTDLMTYKIYKIITGKIFCLTEFVSTILMIILLSFRDKFFDKFHYDILGFINFFPLCTMIAIYCLKIQVMGYKFIYRKKLLIILLLVLLAIMCEKIADIALDSYNHRFAQTVIPLFLLDLPYFTSSRRFIRQSMTIFPKFLGILILMFLLILIYSVLGFAMFSSVSGDYHFGTFFQSFISMFVLLTAANSPNVLMAAYHYTNYTVIFYTSFVIIAKFILMNVILAVTYQLYVFEEKAKFKKIFFLQRRSSEAAFNLLLSQKCPQGITKEIFDQFMTDYGEKSLLKSASMFALMDSSNKGYLNLEDFYSFYKYIDIVWNTQKLKRFKKNSKIKTKVTALRNSLAYKLISYAFITVNSLYLVYEMTSPSSKYRMRISNVDIYFIICFVE